VPDRNPARQLGQLVLREGVLHEAHGAVGVELLRVARDDARRLLPAVLKRMKAEVRDVGGLGVIEDPEDAAFVVKAIVVVRVGLPAAGPARSRWWIEHDETALGGHSAPET